MAVRCALGMANFECRVGRRGGVATPFKGKVSLALRVVTVWSLFTGFVQGQVLEQLTVAVSVPAAASALTVSSVASRLSSPIGNSEQDSVRRLSLEECERHAVARYPKVQEARARLRRVRQELREAHYAPFTDFRGTAGFSFPPSRRGNQIYSLDDNQTLDNDNRFSWTMSVSGVVPLWTFGKISNLWKAADAQVGYMGHEVSKVENEVVLAVREAYYGWQFAREALTLVKGAIEQLSGFEATVAEQVDEGDADEADLFRLQLQLTDLRARKSEAVSQREIAQASLAFLVGSKAGEFLIANAPLQAVEYELAPLENYQVAAATSRPELGMARFGVKARRSQVGQAKSALYPDIGLGLSASWSRSPGVTEQRNPFIANLGNGRGFAAALGLQWKMDFLPQLARIGQAEARLSEVEATARFARGGVGVEVAEAYRKTQHAERQLSLFTGAAKLAHRWLVSTQQGIAIGAYESDDLVAPAKEYALKRFAEINAIYEFNLAFARLALVVGDSTIGSVR